MWYDILSVVNNTFGYHVCIIRQWMVDIVENVLLTNNGFDPAARESLERYGYRVFVAPNGDEEVLAQLIIQHRIVATYSRVEQITRRVLTCSDSLRVCAQNGIGYDNIDLEAASQRGIKVVNLPMGPAYGVAEHTIALMFSLARDLCRLNDRTKGGQWLKGEPSRAVEVAGKVLLLLGFGNIGKLVAKKARALGLVVAAYDPYLSAEEMARHGVEKVDTLPEGLARGDYVSVHAPLSEETTGMFGDPEFAAMKPGAFFLNLGRGPIVQEQALYRALAAKTIAGAAIDVFETEPPAADNPLFSLENLIVTPHIAGMTKTARG